MTLNPKSPKVIIVLPAYNAAKTLEKTLKDIPEGSYDEIILVDDCSTDGTFEKAKQIGLPAFRHAKNLGYGGNQKTCYREALKRGADIVVMLHPDNQYDARLVPYMTGLIKDGVCDIIFGTRIRTRREALKGGMPAYKYFMNRFLTLVEGSVLGLVISEMHTGYRAYSRAVLEKINFEANSDDFVFDQQFVAQAMFHGFSIGEIPVPTRYHDEASSINFRRSVVYGLSTLITLVQFVFHKIGLVKSRIFYGTPGA